MMEKLETGIWLALPLLALLLLLTFAGFPFGGPLALVVFGGIVVVIVGLAAMMAR